MSAAPNIVHASEVERLRAMACALEEASYLADKQRALLTGTLLFVHDQLAPNAPDPVSGSTLRLIIANVLDLGQEEQSP